MGSCLTKGRYAVPVQGFIFKRNIMIMLLQIWPAMQKHKTRGRIRSKYTNWTACFPGAAKSGNGLY